MGRLVFFVIRWFRVLSTTKPVFELSCLESLLPKAYGVWAIFVANTALFNLCTVEQRRIYSIATCEHLKVRQISKYDFSTLCRRFGLVFRVAHFNNFILKILILYIYVHFSGALCSWCLQWIFCRVVFRDLAFWSTLVAWEARFPATFSRQHSFTQDWSVAFHRNLSNS